MGGTDLQMGLRNHWPWTVRDWSANRPSKVQGGFGGLGFSQSRDGAVPEGRGYAVQQRWWPGWKQGKQGGGPQHSSELGKADSEWRWGVWLLEAAPLSLSPYHPAPSRTLFLASLSGQAGEAIRIPLIGFFHPGAFLCSKRR